MHELFQFAFFFGLFVPVTSAMGFYVVDDTKTITLT